MTKASNFGSAIQRAPGGFRLIRGGKGQNYYAFHFTIEIYLCIGDFAVLAFCPRSDPFNGSVLWCFYFIALCVNVTDVIKKGHLRGHWP